MSSRGAGLDDPARLHHHHAVGDLGHHAEVVGDEQNAGAAPALQLADEAQISACVVTSSAVVGSSAISRPDRAPGPPRS
jgi:hypothetical protein